MENMTRKQPDRSRWGAKKLEQDINNELHAISDLLRTIERHSHVPSMVEQSVNLVRISLQSIQLLMSNDYKTVTRLGNADHEGRIAELETQIAEQQRRMEEMHATIEEMRVIQFRRERKVE
jgi:hypothetical protein